MVEIEFARVVLVDKKIDERAELETDVNGDDGKGKARRYARRELRMPAAADGGEAGSAEPRGGSKDLHGVLSDAKNRLSELQDYRDDEFERGEVLAQASAIGIKDQRVLRPSSRKPWTNWMHSPGSATATGCVFL